MSRTLDDSAVTAPRTATRLLHGLVGGAVPDPDPGLGMHLDRWGDVRHQPLRLINELEASGLVGHGGAWFPVGTKWRAVAEASRRRPVVVANGSEGEPASRKDAFLLSHAPHLVLDGLALAASTLRAQQAIAYVPTASMPSVATALAERRSLGFDPIDIELVESPDTFIAGQESAVVNALGGRRGALPSFVGLTSIRERGIGGRPTLVQNVETLAHVALVARFGAEWFRSVGSIEHPGTMLLTVNRPGRHLVVEVALDSSLQAALGLGEDDLANTSAYLLGGYGGSWVSPDTFAKLLASETAARRAGATLGAGVIVPLPHSVCPLAEMADVVRYMEGQGAGQCGPCVHGLAELAQSMDRVAYGPRGGSLVDRILETTTLVEGRGACRHPDGVVRFIRSGLRVFADEVVTHQRRGPCPRTQAARVLPVSRRTARRRLVSRA
jgi:NADH:ubiquinone oxidoreductase subunit F (NADH-binding)